MLLRNLSGFPRSPVGKARRSPASPETVCLRPAAATHRAGSDSGTLAPGESRRTTTPPCRLRKARKDSAQRDVGPALRNMSVFNPCSRPKADRANFAILSFFFRKSKILFRKNLKFLLNFIIFTRLFGFSAFPVSCKSATLRADSCQCSFFLL